jgi:hypothetical protein
MTENNLLDDINQNTQPEETFKHGFYFQFPGRFVGLALSTTGFFMFISLIIIPMLIGTAMITFGVYMFTGTSGIDINYSDKTFKEYNKVLGIKFGKWKSLNLYPFISVMSANRSNKASDITGLNKMVVTQQALGVYLLTNSHRTKILLKRTSPLMEQAKAEAERITGLTEKELIKYNPRRLLRNK